MNILLILAFSSDHCLLVFHEKYKNPILKVFAKNQHRKKIWTIWYVIQCEKQCLSTQNNIKDIKYSSLITLEIPNVQAKLNVYMSQSFPANLFLVNASMMPINNGFIKVGSSNFATSSRTCGYACEILMYICTACIQWIREVACANIWDVILQYSDMDQPYSTYLLSTPFNAQNLYHATCCVHTVNNKLSMVQTFHGSLVFIIMQGKLLRFC